MTRDREPARRGGPTGAALGRLVVPSSLRRQVATQGAGRVLKALLARPDVERHVRSLAVQDLFLLVKQVGLQDAIELLEVAEPDQVQRMVDLDIWARDRVDLERYAEWFPVLVEVYRDRLETLLDDIDIEPLLVFLHKHVRFHPIDPDMPEAVRKHLESLNVSETPDHFFYMEIPPNDPHEDLVRAFFDLLYGADLKLAHRVIYALIAELPSQLEETAYRLRTGRMEELGFFEFFEALAIYQPLPAVPPFRRRRGPAPGGPVLVPQKLLGRPRNAFFAEALDAFFEAYPGEGLEQELVALANRVLVAERLDPGELEDQKRAIQIVLDLAGLGLELSSSGKMEQAVEVLRDVQVEWLFRLGHTRTLELQKRARRLERSLPAPYRRLPGPHADSLTREVLEGLRGVRPRYYTGLDAGVSKPEWVPFSVPGQLARVDEVLDELRDTYRFVFSHLAIEPVSSEELARSLSRHHLELTPGGVLLTATANRMLGHAFRPSPLKVEDFQRWLPMVFEGAVLPGRIRRLRPGFVEEMLDTARAFDREHGEAGPGHVAPFVERLLGALREAYGGLDETRPLRAELVGGPVYLAS